jgi:PilZ domain
MTRSSPSENRKNPRRGLALRVVLRDHRPPMHATTCDVSLGGMHVVTATRKFESDRTLTAEIEVGRGRAGWTVPIPVRIVWANNTSAGVAFGELPAAAIAALKRLLEARERH